MFGLGTLLQAVVPLGRVGWGTIFFPHGHGGDALQPTVLTVEFHREVDPGLTTVGVRPRIKEGRPVQS